MKTIIHYKAGSYLNITENWIYGQINNLKKYYPIVYALKTIKLDMFPTEKIRSLELLKNNSGKLFAFLNKGWNKLFKFYPYFILTLRKDKPDLIHAHYGPSGYSFLKIKEMFKLPLITTFYGYDLSMLPHQNNKWKKRYKKLFQQGNYFLVEGHHMKKCLMKLGCSKKKIIVQHLGVDLDNIKFKLREPGKNREIRILIAGSFREKKGIPYAIESFGRAKKKYKNLQLTIIGDSNGTPETEAEKKKILTLINRYNLNNCIRMLGYQPHSVFLKELYKHHIFFSPSVHASNGDTEGGAPVAIIEASASGMPILSTTHCDIPEVVINGKSGYLVPERNVDILLKKIEVLVLNPNSWERMGLNGRRHIEKNYDIKKQVYQLEKIYDKAFNDM